MTATNTDARVEPPVLEELVRGLVRVLETGEGHRHIFSEHATFDLNVPSWRFQLRGSTAFEEWWHQEVQRRGRVTIGRSVPTPVGFVVETSIEFEYQGQELYARQILLCEVAGDRIIAVILYCTGDWDSETRARQANEAPMLHR